MQLRRHGPHGINRRRCRHFVAVVVTAFVVVRLSAVAAVAPATGFTGWAPDTSSNALGSQRRHSDSVAIRILTI